MNSLIYRQVAKPARLLYASKKLIGLELCLGVVVGIIANTPIAMLGVWLITHPICIVISMREPHIDSVLDAVRDRHPKPNHWKTEDRTYVA